jgi:hypothetical protein
MQGYKSWLKWYVSVINAQIQGKKPPVEYFFSKDDDPNVINKSPDL